MSRFFQPKQDSKALWDDVCPSLFGMEFHKWFRDLFPVSKNYWQNTLPSLIFKISSGVFILFLNVVREIKSFISFMGKLAIQNWSCNLFLLSRYVACYVMVLCCNQDWQGAMEKITFDSFVSLHIRIFKSFLTY